MHHRNTGASVELFFSKFATKKYAPKEPEILSICEERNEDSRDLSPTREFEEKKDQAKTKLL
jgi:hypothetical protein